MTNFYQLDLFKDPQISMLEAEMEAVKLSSNKVRKSIFAKCNKLKKELDELKESHEILLRNICKSKVVEFEEIETNQFVLGI